MRPHGLPICKDILRQYRKPDGKAGELPNIMIVATESNATTCIIHARADEACTTEGGGQASTQWDSTHLIHAIHYKQPVRRDEKVHKYNAMKELD